MTSSLSQAAREKMALDYLAERALRDPKVTPPITYGNSTTTSLYTGNRMQSGRGAAADHHRQFASLTTKGLI